MRAGVGHPQVVFHGVEEVGHVLLDGQHSQFDTLNVDPIADLHKVGNRDQNQHYREGVMEQPGLLDPAHQLNCHTEMPALEYFCTSPVIPSIVKEVSSSRCSVRSLTAKRR